MSLAAAAQRLLDELETERLAVELFPAPQPRFPGHLIRIATGANPAWYRRLAKSVPPRHRHPGRCTTGIRREHVAQALCRIAMGRPLGTTWERIVMPAVAAAVVV